jgi:hypothetical protein
MRLTPPPRGQARAGLRNFPEGKVRPGETPNDPQRNASSLDLRSPRLLRFHALMPLFGTLRRRWYHLERDLVVGHHACRQDGSGDDESQTKGRLMPPFVAKGTASREGCP